ncbi:hypothetical protein B0H11DRAFT_1983025 [Mycena galericulata]|nr:hypothetical protein B0H11DRAFT_1983025 [Mycena galericulata]
MLAPRMVCRAPYSVSSLILSFKFCGPCLFLLNSFSFGVCAFKSFSISRCYAPSRTPALLLLLLIVRCVVIALIYLLLWEDIEELFRSPSH